MLGQEPTPALPTTFPNWEEKNQYFFPSQKETIVKEEERTYNLEVLLIENAYGVTASVSIIMVRLPYINICLICCDLSDFCPQGTLSVCSAEKSHISFKIFQVF